MILPLEAFRYGPLFLFRDFSFSSRRRTSLSSTLILPESSQAWNSSISTFGNELLNGLGLRLAFSKGKKWSTDVRSVWQEGKPNLSYRKSARKPGAACS